MDEQEFKLEVVRKLSKIETDVEHLKRSPNCRFNIAEEKIQLNRRLIFFLMGINFPLLAKVMYDKFI